MRLLLPLLALLACKPTPPTPPAANPSAEIVTEWQAAQDRLLSSFAPDGFVVSLADDGAPRNQGDSLIWTGVAMASMDCARGARLSQALQGMVKTLNGGLWRHPSLPDQVSLDGALGFYLGVAHRLKACKEGDAWAPLLALHKAYAPLLNQAAGVTLDEPFAYIRDRLTGDGPNPNRLQTLETALAAWATGVKATKAACFRVHLGLLSLQTLEALGDQVDGGGRFAFCAATSGLDLPTSDHWCGRGDLAGWVAGFQYNLWQYRHQRCPAWETPDGEGLAQPGVDLLRGLVDNYNFTY